MLCVKNITFITIFYKVLLYMKFISFNINGLRAHLHQLEKIIKKHQPDVIGLQETKVDDDIFPLQEISKYGYHVFYHGQKKHYGVAILTLESPVGVRRGFPTDHQDAQRRIIMADLVTKEGILTVINGYFPQGDNRNNLIKFQAKSMFYQDLLTYLEQNLSVAQLVLIMGDMNISHSNLDIGIGKEAAKRWLRTGKCSFLPEERVWMDHLFHWGLIDTYRHNNPTSNDEFSWFDYRSKGFEENRGLRIDLVLASPLLAERCISSGIDYQIRRMERPSDHAPVWADFEL